MTELGDLEQSLGKANKRALVCFLVFMAAAAFFLFCMTRSWNGVAVVSGVVAAVSFIAIFVARQLYREAFDEFWGAAGLNQAQIDQKWQELYPSGD
ncbi:hypothetical protein DWF00_13605 [Bosea caraganae]|uniref:Uncharacterized protein n=1 Tax=Bosea caraganae TaxID=2763117 RepID=A0A370L2K3_9HYPH|nr:hypothetical protein [Bosea caraganae]RDJ21346.1 hypothetical protein DWE98_21770 [Bosea caraganae]RDJ26486.1 hypothetical protein DWF00_13605 [Bosea caraganae]